MRSLPVCVPYPWHPPQCLGEAALQVAVSKGHSSVAELLLKHRADVEAKSNAGPATWRAEVCVTKRDENQEVQGCNNRDVGP